MTSGGIDWQREKWQSGLGSKFIHQGEKNAVKYADEVIVLSKGVQDYFKKTADHQMNMFEDFIGYHSYDEDRYNTIGDTSAGRISQKTEGALIGNIDQFIGKVNEILFVVYYLNQKS